MYINLIIGTEINDTLFKNIINDCMSKEYVSLYDQLRIKKRMRYSKISKELAIYLLYLNIDDEDFNDDGLIIPGSIYKLLVIRDQKIFRTYICMKSICHCTAKDGSVNTSFTFPRDEEINSFKEFIKKYKPYGISGECKIYMNAFHNKKI